MKRYPGKVLYAERDSLPEWEKCKRTPPGRQPPHFLKEEPFNMAQKVVGYIQLQIPAGKATPAPR